MLALLLACAPDEETSKNPGTLPEAAPDLVVTPASFDLGEVAVGASATQAVTLENAGDGALQLDNLATGGDAAFTVTDLATPILQPGEATTLTVTYTPEEPVQAEGWLVVTSSDPEAPEARVDFTGSGVAPEVLAEPSELQFGRVMPGCSDTLAFTLSNDGNADLVVSDVTIADANGDFSTDAVAPLTLAPGESTEVAVTYVANHTGSATLTLLTNDPAAPEVELLATGEVGAWPVVTDTFTNPDGVDIVVLLDASDSMASYLSTLRQDLLDFYEALVDDATVPWQLSVVVEDDGCIDATTPYVDASMDADTAIDRLRVMANADAGSGAEEGFTILQNALSDASRAGCNAGILRDHAALAVVRLTDGPEESTTLWSDELTFLQGLVDDPEDVTVHTLAGDWPAGCDGAAAASGWYELTVATGGVYGSICALAASWPDLTEGIDIDGPGDTYPLSVTPDPSTIVVTVDRVVSDRWTWDEAQNAVVFLPESVPGAGTEVGLLYEEPHTCD